VCLTCDNAYFAGLVDGEGYVGIRTVRHTGGWISFAVQVTVTNAFESVLREGLGRWGGSMHSYRKSTKGHQVWKWQITGQQASRLLADIFPYLRIKAAQAELAMELQVRIDAIRHRRQRTVEENTARLDLQTRCRELNQRVYNGEYIPPRLKAIGGGCLTCGCRKPTDSHGDPRNITTGKLRQAQQAGGRKSLDHTARTLTSTLRSRRGKGR
jgi:hypothetical protein